MLHNEMRAEIMDSMTDLVSVTVVSGEAFVPVAELKTIVANINLAIAMHGIAVLGDEGPQGWASTGQVQIGLLLADLIDLLEVKAATEVL